MIDVSVELPNVLYSTYKHHYFDSNSGSRKYCITFPSCLLIDCEPIDLNYVDKLLPTYVVITGNEILYPLFNWYTTV